MVKTIGILFIISVVALLSLQVYRFSKFSQTHTVMLRNKIINVEIADTEAKRSKGLSEREALAQDAGMLFIFPKAERYSFWMKDMRFPLDFIWINGDKVVDITQNVKVSVVSNDFQLPIYSPDYPADKVLEVNAGTVQSIHITDGDTVNFK